MGSNRPTRRQYLLTASAGAASLIAGCGSNSESPDDTNGTSDPAETPTGTPTGETTDEPTATATEELPEDRNPGDGLPPEFDEQPSEMAYSPSEFTTHSEEVDGTTYEVPIVPLDVAYNLYARREARIVDARVAAGYDVSHVLGAVRSLTPEDDGPTSDWEQSGTVITYCHCPYHTSVRRAAQLLDDGFEEVFALEGGYQAWKVAGHPTDGEGVPSSAQTWTVEGESDASSGDVAYIYHSATDQVAGAEIESGGNYTLEFAFASVSGSDEVTVGAPGYEQTGTLNAVTSGTVTPDGIEVGTGTTTPNGTTTDDGMGTTTDDGMGNTTDNGTANGTGTDDDTFGRVVGGFLR